MDNSDVMERCLKECLGRDVAVKEDPRHVMARLFKTIDDANTRKG